MRPAIDFDKLRQFLSREIVEGRESYEFTWVGKRGAIAEAGKPTSQTLRPDLEESVDFDKSENVFITGDNLEVLKVLQESYLGKIDMIYIDPPYNTGKDFVYSDKFQMSEEELADEMDLRDEDGLQRVGLTKNEKSSARYHSDWLNMMYPRLVLARNLLKDSGVIFISIDDNEQANLKAICDEIFGEENFVANFVWEKGREGGNDSSLLRSHYENILSYCVNNKAKGIINLDPKDTSRHIVDLPEKNLVAGIIFEKNIGEPFQLINLSKQKDYLVKIPLVDGTVIEWSSYAPQSSINTWITEGKVFVGTKRVPYVKSYLKDELQGQKPSNIINQKYGTTKAGTIEVRNYFGDRKIFPYAKPSSLLKRLLTIGSSNSSFILDFFAGSATTADAVMQLNAEDGGNRKYILCTLDEQVADKSAAKEAGYETIDQISRERIRRAAKKIQEEHPETVGKQDFGFRAYKLDSSNFKDVSQTPDSFSQDSLFDSVSNIKDGRTDLDLLFQIMLTWGMELSLPIAKTQIDGTDIYNVAGGALIACFADEILESVLRQIAKEEPLRAVFKDESFANSAAKINLGQIFKEETPNTKVKVV
ncbi:site-specific DNA-methyltransferase [Streptococcus suis]|uniref:site-specific DNA-methyltransferase n=1 Tax=Streptococcus suis TaxID=1307 RepID=UPI001C95E15C|nr:site-specific DNA-methyltransferase [Streptococcus suis]MBY4961849.1 site-specific DNA-methyltransferase [Streptococcus suis]MBY4968184.1 site-specific DNA-methyltransferase [Streptococcus suis]MBY4979260.1 site-specific DNA-methyltransferase [Streptococcus suis]MBY4987842.1 site-specific DNA-methyltransferase [Streptococcus suis]MBY4994419.1 site-specific DNA-methyltransferase [Streptococcus suis]